MISNINRRIIVLFFLLSIEVLHAQKVVVTSPQGELFIALYEVDMNGSNLKKIEIEGRSGRGEGQAHFSPDNTKLVFRTYAYGGWKVAVSRPSGGGLKKAYHANAYGFHPRWSPDGTWIVYDGPKQGNSGDNHIYKVDPDNGNRIQLTNFDNDWSTSPLFSPDGKKIVFQRYTPDTKQYDIYIIDKNGRNLQRVTHSSDFDEFSPSWSPNGKQICFLSNKDNFINLYILDLAEDGDVINVTNDFETSPFKGAIGSMKLDTNYGTSWSPDGETIAFVWVINGRRKVFLIKPDGSGLSQLLNWDKEEMQPTWKDDI